MPDFHFAGLGREELPSVGPCLLQKMMGGPWNRCFRDVGEETVYHLSQQGADPKAGKQKGQKDTMPSGEGRSGSVPQGGPGTQKRVGRLELKKEEREEWEYGTGRAFCKHHDAPGYCVCVCVHTQGCINTFPLKERPLSSSHF